GCFLVEDEIAKAQIGGDRRLVRSSGRMRREIEFPGDLNSRSFDLRKIGEIEIFAVEIEFKDMRSEIVHSAACNVSAPAGKLKVEGTVGRELPCGQYSVAVAFKGFVRAMKYGIVNGEISRRSLHVGSQGIPFQLRLRS